MKIRHKVALGIVMAIALLVLSQTPSPAATSIGTQIGFSAGRSMADADVRNANQAFGINADVRMSEDFSIDLRAVRMDGSKDVASDATSYAGLVGINYHLTGFGDIDPYVGGGGGFVWRTGDWGPVSTTYPVVAAGAGFDVGLSKKFGINVDGHYLRHFGGTDGEHNLILTAGVIIRP